VFVFPLFHLFARRHACASWLTVYDGAWWGRRTTNATRSSRSAAYFAASPDVSPPQLLASRASTSRVSVLLLVPKTPRCCRHQPRHLRRRLPSCSRRCLEPWQVPAGSPVVSRVGVSSAPKGRGRGMGGRRLRVWHFVFWHLFCSSAAREKQRHNVSTCATQKTKRVLKLPKRRWRVPRIGQIV
jgi:hypothetical protein